MKELERAIQAGNVDGAAQLASELARRRTRITITPSSPSQSPERPIRQFFYSNYKCHVLDIFVDLIFGCIYKSLFIHPKQH